jgi:uncharacterized protein (DUF2235 family)
LILRHGGEWIDDRARNAMGKNVVLCCDGTNNEFGAANTNVIKIYQALVHDPPRQLLYYHPGLGTMGAPNALTPPEKWATRVLGLAFGYGLSEHLTDLYARIMETYEPGDRLYLFGFSRGAFTARALASMLHMFGLIRRGNEVMIPYAIRLLKRKDRARFETAAKFKSTFSDPVKIHFVGVWDTVSSVGALHDPLRVPYTATNPDIVTGRHAVALDERRAFYRQNLWVPADGQDIQQVWFAGAHSDVGGGYPERESGLSKIALAWMAAEARAAGIFLDDERLARVLGAAGEYAKPDPMAKLHDSLSGWWWAELIPRRYVDWSDPEHPKTRWKIPLGRPRFVAPGAAIHESVFERMDAPALHYHPRNLPGVRRTVVGAETRPALP